MKTHYIMSLQNGYKHLLIVLMALFICTFTACKKDFEKYNTDNTGLKNGQFQIGLVYPNIQASIFGLEGPYQLAQNLSADCYSGYMMSPNPFRGNINNLNYSLVDGWNSRSFIDSYTTTLFSINAIAKAGTRTSAPDFWGIALILKVEAFHRMTDKFGPIAYSAAGNTIVNTPYDSQQNVYQQFFLQLDTAVNNLNTFIKANPGKTPFAAYDLVYSGDYTRWVKFANSLRLRLAMHIVKADAPTAQAQAQKAIDPTNGGVMTVNSDNAGISGGGYHNPLNVITTSWTDISAGAALESYLVGYQDPRTSAYLLPATDPKFTGQYKGIRIGSNVTAKPGYNGFSTLNFNTIVGLNSPMMMMNAAEVWFLKAEAALRGWTGFGDPQSNYNTGIQTSMNQWGASGSTYINDASSLPTGYVDPLNSDNNSNPVSTITIKWNSAATPEVNLERIITQKWLAMFPEGQEAWTEYRRTGYPKLFPVVNNNSNNTISTTIQIRRLPYPSDEYSTNGTEVKKAVQLLGGNDNGGTRVWWDVNKPNF
ncbi:SusD/RagB family nutrient-binding outer membrane lipoprotein [Pedobacter nutrimenti]|uniref:SusD/RagB-like outer membrane lipoprotein n=1 Tax=Pedobacter nutrimenti TaxID=1241337 RepID=A0A318UGV5_9SPHI|nr:SusD/RagB family nutrient-binding outer membrane lipoprotein [Pedobacter nutrimenti]PYF75582.1 SusD/RagB-like outer membrane lipoprotein [Pedobacter nutrimenti]